MYRSSIGPLALLIRIVQSSKKIYHEAPDVPQQEYFNRFLARLPEDLQSYYSEKGFEASKQSMLFRRFILAHDNKDVKNRS